MFNERWGGMSGILENVLWWVDPLSFGEEVEM